MTTPYPELAGLPVIATFSIDTETDYGTSNIGSYKKIPAGVAHITVVNRTDVDVHARFYNGTRFDSAELVPPRKSVLFQRVVPAAAWGIRIDLPSGTNSTPGMVGITATVFPNTG